MAKAKATAKQTQEAVGELSASIIKEQATTEPKEKFPIRIYYRCKPYQEFFIYTDEDVADKPAPHYDEDDSGANGENPNTVIYDGDDYKEALNLLSMYVRQVEYQAAASAT